jgi:calcineurin-like phosphoesterase family protein
VDTWFSADLHGYHRNMIWGISNWESPSRCRTQFDTLEQMNETLIGNINACVKPNDIFYILGDFTMGGASSIWKFREAITCRTIHLILGNHDIHISKNAVLKTPMGPVNAQSLFTSVTRLLSKKIAGVNTVLCHYPIYSWEKKKHGSHHYYGHSHAELNYAEKAVCVSVDAHPEFRPFHADELKQIINQRIYDNSTDTFE